MLTDSTFNHQKTGKALPIWLKDNSQFSIATNIKYLSIACHRHNHRSTTVVP